MSILMYYRTYYTLMPLSSYLLFDNLKGLGPSIYHSIQLSDLVLVLPVLFYTIIHWLIFHKVNCQVCICWKKKTLILAIPFFMGMGIVSGPYWPNQRPFYQQPLYLFKITAANALKQYGIINYWIYQYLSIMKVLDDSKNYAQNYVKKMRHSSNLACVNEIGTKNLILILVESLQSWPIGLHVGTCEVTPCINNLINDTSVIYFPKIMS